MWIWRAVREHKMAYKRETLWIQGKIGRIKENVG